MSIPQKPRIDWSLYPDLVRLYRAIEQVEGARLADALPSTRTGTFACYAWLAAQLPVKVNDVPAMRMYSMICALTDKRVQLEPRQRHLLGYITGYVLGLWEQDARRRDAQRLLASALELCRLTWTPSAWAPWMGPAPVYRPRRNVMDLDPSDPSDDPTGDPEEEQPRWMLEPSRSSSEPVPIRYVLEGIDAWQDVCRTELGLDVGLFSADARSALERLVQLEQVPAATQEREIVREVMQWLAAA